MPVSTVRAPSLIVSRRPRLTASSRTLEGESAATGRRRVPLLVGAIAGADERPGEDGAEAECLALLAQPPELVGVHPTLDRRVLRRRLQVLPDRDDVDAVLAQITHRLHDLVVR